VNAMHLEPDSRLFADMLDEISRQTDREGLGMLSAVVIHKGDDYLPGDGFFKRGRELGRDPSDRPSPPDSTDRKRAFLEANLVANLPRSSATDSQ
jgi:hypothetical protein